MKYCPTCTATFEGDEVFCPHDGTRLLTRGSIDPGALVGSSLAGVVNLDTFLRRDHLGELYHGRLLSDGSDVQTRIFHRNYSPETLAKATNLLRSTDGALPPEILSVAGLFTEQRPYFLVEESSAESSLAQLIATRGPLGWRDALAMGCRLARALEWIGARGAAPLGVSPASIYVDEDLRTLRLGGWLVGHLATELPAIDASTPLDALPLSPAYVAPELLRDASAPHGPAAVFSVGAILFELLRGESPLPPDATPAQLVDPTLYPPIPSLESVDLSDAPEALPDLLRMSLARDPSRRFQAPAALIAALATMLGSSPDAIAPPLQPALRPVFGQEGRTGPLALPAYAGAATAGAQVDVAGETQPQQERHTMIGLPAAALTDPEAARDADLAENEGPPRVIIDDPGEGRPPVTTAPFTGDAFDSESEGASKNTTSPLNALTDAPEGSDTSSPETDARLSPSTRPLNPVEPSPSQTPSESGASASQNTVSEPEASATSDASKATAIDAEKGDKKTLMMTSVSVQTLSDEVETADEELPPSEPEASDADATSTSATAPEEASAAVAGEVAGRPEVARKKEDAGPSIVVAEELQEKDRPTPDTSVGDASSPDAPSPSEKSTEGTKDPPGPSIVVAEELQEKERPAPDTSEGDVSSPDAPSPSNKSPEGKRDANATADRNEDSATSEASSSPRVSKHVQELNIGAINAARSNDTSGDMDEGWFSDAGGDAWAEDALRQAQEDTRARDRLVRIGLVVILVGIFIAIFFVTQSYEPPTEEVPESSTETSAVDIERLEGQFKDAMQRGAIISPRPTSALEYLTQLKRHAPTRYEELRPEFVQAADEASRRFEAQKDWQRARDLSGFASQHAPEDAALRERAEAIQARYVENLEGDKGAPTDTESASAIPRQEASDGKKSAPSAKQETSARPTEGTNKDSAGARGDAEASFQEARQAYARGDFDGARRAYERTLNLRPNHAGANAGLGKILFDQAQLTQAERYQRRAVDARPDNLEYRLQLGTVLFRQGRYSDAIQAWQEVLRRDPDNADAQRFIELAQRRTN
ncbi:hypothetical protein DL240_12750 [Lujinxingia litoralis]|uniref:Protein kinase domain-containing protein n=1 Tax=Lujinxingia litoralis TaxID=2211119 RepID=A0A328C686_9DELT|nr:tetratricopeptide repeat protein [Lujinxingia litoralis]RAL21717.1 hypothetical protein DL240_12750 [Lujinxingia litoralis]